MMQDKVYMMRFGEEIDSCQALLHPVFKERSKSIENQIKRRAGMAAALLFQYAVYRIFHTEVMDNSQIIEIPAAELQEMPEEPQQPQQILQNAQPQVPEAPKASQIPPVG